MSLRFPGCRGSVIAVSILLAAPATAQTPERLHESGRITPALAFPDAEVRPRRSDEERRLADSRQVLVPVFTTALVPATGQLPVGWVRSTLKLGAYRYDLSGTGAEVVEMYRSFVQGLVTDRVLPAARQIPEFSEEAERLSDVEVAVDDVLNVYIGVPASLSGGQTPVITVDFGLSHTVTAYAYVSLYLDKMLSADREDLEAVYAAWERYLNAYLLITESEFSRARGGDRLFDQGVLDSLYPGVGSDPKDHGLFLHHVENISLLLFAHETCHFLLRHHPGDGVPRQQKEIAADVCAARIFGEIREPITSSAPDLPHYAMLLAARYLSQASLVTWPADGELSAYPLPGERHDAIMEAFPPEAFPGLSEEAAAEFAAQPNPALDVLLKHRGSLAIPLPKDDAEAEVAMQDRLVEHETQLVDYCEQARCLDQLRSDDRHIRFIAIRAVVDLAAVKAKLRERVSGETDLGRDALSLLIAAYAATDEAMPVTRASISSLTQTLQDSAQPN